MEREEKKKIENTIHAEIIMRSYPCYVVNTMHEKKNHLPLNFSLCLGKPITLK